MVNLILGFCTNQELESIKIFLASARKYHSEKNTHIAIITNSTRGLTDLAREFKVELVCTPSTYGAVLGRTEQIIRRLVLELLRRLAYSKIMGLSGDFARGYRTLMEVWQHPHIIRWNAYQKYINFNPNYSYIALCDIRDVVFQSAIFDTDIIKNAVLGGEDSAPLNGEDINSQWLIEAFGRQTFSRFKGRIPLCVGIIIGTGIHIETLVTEFCKVFFADPFKKVEQALFNRLYFEGRFSVRVIADVNGTHIATLGGDFVENNVTIKDGVLVNSVTGIPFPIVHMYDRFPEIREAVEIQYLG